jgi:hypothetical protein
VKSNQRCLISWNNKLDIDNCEMALMKDKEIDKDGKEMTTD